MSKISRTSKILRTTLRYGLNRKIIRRRLSFLGLMSYLNPYSYGRLAHSRAISLRLFFESLGPIFIKFGQILSVRRDLLPPDIADELAKLQDNVPPFSGEQAKNIIEKALQQPLEACFDAFNIIPLAAASIAQVHTAQLKSGKPIIIKVLRPHIKKIIDKDIAIMYWAARWLERLWSQGKRLHPCDLVSEFEYTIHNELDLVREAASAAQLRRNFENSSMMYVPQIYWDYTRTHVMVMERVFGTRISDIDTLKKNNTNLKQLAEHGVEIFLTQVFRDNFFHADMHPGNLFVDITDPSNPTYLGVDFGIMGSLSSSDQRYLAENLLAFFNRDYARVAQLHVDCGWVPANTRVDQFESAIRSICEPIFQKPMNEISFGYLLLQLFKTAKQFNMEIQPQLMLLQKTLLAIEGLGRELYPQLDLWHTAKPIVEKWVKDQKHPKKIIKTLLSNWQPTAQKIIDTPSLLFDVLDRINTQPIPQIDTYTTPKRSRALTITGATLLIVGLSHLVLPTSKDVSMTLTILGGASILFDYFKSK